MVVGCVIEFDNNPLCTYFTGQTITGKITLHADKPKKVKGIRLEIAGFAYTHFTTSEGTGSDSSRKSHFGHEDYIKSETCLLGCESDQTTQIMPGIHTYNFASHIPDNCPTSFEGRDGHIRYMVKVILVRPWKFNQTYTKGFTVLKILDLNYDSPVLRVPSQAEGEKTFCCGPCRSRPLHMEVSLPQTGYVPGQAIAVSVLIMNETSKIIDELLVELVMRVIYFERPNSFDKENERIVVTKNIGRGIPKRCKKLLNYGLIVPATPPTCVNLCGIIKISYFVEVTAKVKGMHLGHLISVPVTIGNVPLMGVIQSQPKTIDNLSPAVHFHRGEKEDGISKDAIDTEVLKIDGLQSATIEGDVPKADVSENLPTNRMEPTTPPSPWAENPDIPLPTYEEAMHMQRGKINANEKHDYGEAVFAPRYPVFIIPSPTLGDIANIDGIQFNGGNRGTGVTTKSSTWL